MEYSPYQTFYGLKHYNPSEPRNLNNKQVALCWNGNIDAHLNSHSVSVLDE